MQRKLLIQKEEISLNGKNLSKDSLIWKIHWLILGRKRFHFGEKCFTCKFGFLSYQILQPLKASVSNDILSIGQDRVKPCKKLKIKISFFIAFPGFLACQGANAGKEQSFSRKNIQITCSCQPQLLTKGAKFEVLETLKFKWSRKQSNLFLILPIY